MVQLKCNQLYRKCAGNDLFFVDDKRTHVHCYYEDGNDLRRHGHNLIPTTSFRCRINIEFLSIRALKLMNDIFNILQF